MIHLHNELFYKQWIFSIIYPHTGFPLGLNSVSNVSAEWPNSSQQNENLTTVLLSICQYLLASHYFFIHIVKGYAVKHWISLHRYLRMKHLCKRRRQTFFMESDEENVKKICNGHGVINNEHDNLCTSDSKMLVYYLNVTSNCKILSKKEFRKYVVVACDKVENVCLPVHFEMFTNKRPNGVRPCGPQILYSSRQAHYWPEI